MMEARNDISKIPMSELLPQRQPFVMVDRLTCYDPVTSVTELEVRADNIFVENGVLTESGIIENVAQTCAARIGYANACLSGDGVKLGVIGSIKDLEIYALPKVGDVLHTTIEVQSEMLQLTLVKASVRSGSMLVAEGEMKIAIKE